MDPRRTAWMIEKEENARQHFKKLKDILQMFSLGWWEKNFKHHVDEFIGDRLAEKECITEVPAKDEEEEENDHIHLHGLQCLVAGADQEWELVQQPKYVATCAELDGVLV
jgi:hypothetical protein